MKKLLISFLILIATSLIFAETNIDSIIETFLEKGTYAKIYDVTGAGYLYLQRGNIVFIAIALDTSDIEFYNNFDDEPLAFSLKQWKFTLDEKSNLIIKKS